MPATADRESSEMPPSTKMPYGDVSSLAPAAAGASAVAANTRPRATRPRTLPADRPKIAPLVVVPARNHAGLGRADSKSRTRRRGGRSVRQLEKPLAVGGGLRRQGRRI